MLRARVSYAEDQVARAGGGNGVAGRAVCGQAGTLRGAGAWEQCAGMARARGAGPGAGVHRDDCARAAPPLRES
ncbi:hypothetical protein C2845_PM08G13800 [Panicum miliaceum]|uniref:Uncharacterized protein n=1 Tax=Panicum miliaceum TaxID=4540 RepID=A0A3L6QWV9_PANMI|nr:hypothetical protein C2845_PM08G13800 [Panicum miliaceum]